MGAGGYPARQTRIEKMMGGLVTLSYFEPKTTRADLYPKIEVEDVAKDANSTRVTVKDESGAVLADVIVGKAKTGVAGLDRDGVYIRLPDEERAWLAEGAPRCPLRCGGLVRPERRRRPRRRCRFHERDARGRGGRRNLPRKDRRRGSHGKEPASECRDRAPVSDRLHVESPGQRLVRRRQARGPGRFRGGFRIPRHGRLDQWPRRHDADRRGRGRTIRSGSSSTPTSRRNSSRPTTPGKRRSGSAPGFPSGRSCCRERRPSD